MLNTVTFGNSTNPPLIIAHGLFGSARNWGVLSKRLSDAWHVIGVDLRNHGDSDFYSIHNYSSMAEDLQKTAKKFGADCRILGHSMGGKAAMLFALEQPKIVSKLVVIDIAPVNYLHSQNHVINALQSIDLTQVETRRDADVQLAHFLDDKQLRAFLLQSLKFGNEVYWKLNLPVLKKYMNDIVSFPKSDRIFEGKTLLIKGEKSDYISEEHLLTMRQRFNELKIVQISGAGHWVHAEKPRELEKEIRSFLND